MKEREPQSITINVTYGSKNKIEKMLSNFAPTPFVLNNIEYPSVESFWQGLYFPEGSLERGNVFKMKAIDAKKAAINKDKDLRQIEYFGKEIEIGSSQHHVLMREAIKAKLEQNPDVLSLLLETGNCPITHILKDKNGNLIPDSTSIPGKVFSQILMDLREEFRIR